jgi:uncharacterized protein
MTPTTVEQLRAIGTIDLLVGLPGKGQDYWEPKIRQRLTSADPAYERHLAPYLFKQPPSAYKADLSSAADALAERMDQYGITHVLVPVAEEDTDLLRLIDKSEGKILPQINIDPNDGVQALRWIQRAVDSFGARGVTILPCAYSPPVAINDRRMYPIFGKCAELGIPAFVSVGVPGPRVPFAEQRVELVDDVCHFFPECTIILRHGGLPWIDLAVALLLKWPNLFYSTSAVSPKYWPEALVNFANTRGTDKVLFSGYYPYGFDYDRLFAEMCDVPFREAVWPAFLNGNARRVMSIS